MVEEKNFHDFKCVFSHNGKTRILIIDYYRRGKLFFRTCSQGAKAAFAKRFIKTFDEQIAETMYKDNMEIF